MSWSLTFIVGARREHRERAGVGTGKGRRGKKREKKKNTWHVSVWNPFVFIIFSFYFNVIMFFIIYSDRNVSGLRDQTSCTQTQFLYFPTFSFRVLNK